MKTSAIIKSFIGLLFIFTILDIHAAHGQIGFAFELPSKKDFTWKKLPEENTFVVYYIQLNFMNFPGKTYTGKDITDFKDSIPENSVLLNPSQRQELFELINDSTNFSEGDCGTFHLNAGFIIKRKNKVAGKINIGCGYNQWHFDPMNLNSKYGSFNEIGFAKMKLLLDQLNLSKSKNQ